MMMLSFFFRERTSIAMPLLNRVPGVRSARSAGRGRTPSGVFERAVRGVRGAAPLRARPPTNFSGRRGLVKRGRGNSRPAVGGWGVTRRSVGLLAGVTAIELSEAQVVDLGLDILG